MGSSPVHYYSLSVRRMIYDLNFNEVVNFGLMIIIKGITLLHFEWPFLHRSTTNNSFGSLQGMLGAVSRRKCRRVTTLCTMLNNLWVPCIFYLFRVFALILSIRPEMGGVWMCVLVWGSFACAYRGSAQVAMSPLQLEDVSIFN